MQKEPTSVISKPDFAGVSNQGDRIEMRCVAGARKMMHDNILLYVCEQCARVNLSSLHIKEETVIDVFLIELQKPIVAYIRAFSLFATS